MIHGIPFSAVTQTLSSLYLISGFVGITEYHFSDTPYGTPALKFSKSPITINEDVEFSCKPEGDAGVPEADHFVYYEGDLELHNGTSHWVTQFSVVKDNVPFGCFMGNYVGTGGQKGSARLEVQGRC